MYFEVRHFVLGRLRLRVPALRKRREVAHACLVVLGRLKEVHGVRWNNDCAALVIVYDSTLNDFHRDLITRIRTMEPADWLRQAPSPTDITIAQDESPNWLKRIESEDSALKKPVFSLLLALWGGPFIAVVNLPLLIYNSLPTWRSALRVIKRERRLNVDFLDGMAILVSLAQGNWVTTAVMIALIRLGNWIREHTARRSKRAVRDLLDYQGRKAWVLRGTEVVRVPAASLQVDDHVVIYPGELIPVDGEILRGSAAVDEKTITGESLPVKRCAGESVYAATVVREGKLVVRAKRVGSGTTAAQIVDLVQGAPLGETRIQNYAEKLADRLVAPQLAFGCGLFFITGNVNRFLSMTIIDYGTGMRVAAPTSVLASMAHAAREGIVIRSGSHIEKLAHIDTIVFDKTGTLTTGSPEVLGVISYSGRHFPEQEILGLAAAAEARFEHPVARAVVQKAYEQHVAIPNRSESDYEIGMGVSARVNGFFVHVGSERFLRQKGIALDSAHRDLKNISKHGCSPLLVAVDDSLIGLIPYADRIRPESPGVVDALCRGRRARRAVMLTGDNSTVARAVAEQLSIKQFYADTMPAEKADVVKELQSTGKIVAMVGDGINDSPALAYADIGIAMKNGADVAQESADVVLMQDNLWKLIQAIDISKNSMALIRQNYAIIAGLNTFALLLSLPAGLMSPGTTALISNGSAILAALNAIRPILRY
jgi:heavy metal translocating P-type ATPase